MSYLSHDPISSMAKREQMAERFKPGGDKYESIKADEQWEKAHVEELFCPQCNDPVSKDNEYFVEWGTCSSYCYGKMVGVYS